MKKLFTLTVMLTFSINQIAFGKVETLESKMLQKIAMSRLEAQFKHMSSDEQAMMKSEIEKTLTDAQEKLSDVSDERFSEVMKQGIQEFNSLDTGKEAAKTIATLSEEEKQMIESSDQELVLASNSSDEGLQLIIQKQLKKNISQIAANLAGFTKDDFNNTIKIAKEKMKEPWDGLSLLLIIPILIIIGWLGGLIVGIVGAVAIGTGTMVGLSGAIAMTVIGFVFFTALSIGIPLWLWGPEKKPSKKTN